MFAPLAIVAALAVAPVSAPAACVVTEGAFTWGFKESFRAYVSGSIANGDWSTEGDIDYSTPAFSSDDLVGVLQLDGLAGELAVDGALRFTGHEGILDTTIADPRLQFDGVDQLVLVVDVTGTTQDFVEASAVDVPFLSGDLRAAEWRVEGDLLVIDTIALELTAEGAEAFGTYPEGEAFDPLTLELNAGAECAAAAVDARAATAVPVTVIAIGAVLLAVAALVTYLVVRTRRRDRG